MIRLALTSAVLALCVGFVCGKVYSDRQNVQALADAAEAARKLDYARQVLQTERDRLARDNEDLAREDPVSNPDVLPASRVRRLNSNR